MPMNQTRTEVTCRVRRTSSPTPAADKAGCKAFVTTDAIQANPAYLCKRSFVTKIL